MKRRLNDLIQAAEALKKEVEEWRSKYLQLENESRNWKNRETALVREIEIYKQRLEEIAALRAQIDQLQKRNAFLEH